MNTRILFLGETVGKPGMTAIKKGLQGLKEAQRVDFTVANGEGLSNGFGISQAHAVQLLKTGVDVITTGEKTYYKKDMVEAIQKISRLIRPANFPAGNPGRGFKTIKIGELNVGFITLLGTAGFNRITVTNPFIHATSLVSKLSQECDSVILQFPCIDHSRRIDHGLPSGWEGSRCHPEHIQKSSQVTLVLLPKGTAFITDNGMCGSIDGVGGFDAEPEIKRFIDQIPSRSQNGNGSLELQGAIVELGPERGSSLYRTNSISCTRRRTIMYEIAQVVSIKDKNHISVTCSSSACKSCSAGALCSTKGKTFIAKDTTDNDIHVGDTVELFLPPAKDHLRRLHDLDGSPDPLSNRLLRRQNPVPCLTRGRSHRGRNHRYRGRVPHRKSLLEKQKEGNTPSTITRIVT